MKAEQVLTVAVERHTFETDRPFGDVLSGIYAGISQPDISALFAALAKAATWAEFSALVRQAQGSAGLMRFLELDLDVALARDQGSSRRLVRIIAGNPVTMESMTRHVPDAGSYAPVTILVEEIADGGTRVAYDTVASALAPYPDDSARAVAGHLDYEVLSLLRQATA